MNKRWYIFHRLQRRRKNPASVSRTHAGRSKEEVKPKRYAYPFLYAFFVFGMLSSGYLLSPMGHVNQIHVEGESEVPEQHIIDASEITEKQTVLGILSHKEQLEDQIRKELPRIQTAVITPQGINDLVIQVADFRTVAYMEKGSGYQCVLENGEVLEEEQTVPRGSKPILKNFEKEKNLEKLVAQLRGLNEEIINSISEVSYTGTKTNPDAITLFMNDGNQVKASLKDFSKKMSYYPDILSQIGAEKGIVNMEVGVYFEPFPEKTKTDSKKPQPEKNLNEE